MICVCAFVRWTWHQFLKDNGSLCVRLNPCRSNSPLSETKMQSATTTVETTARPRQNWLPWILVSLATFLFAILCFVSGRRMEDYAEDGTDWFLSIFRPVIITSIFTGVVIFIFIVVSFFITWGRSTNDYASRYLDVLFSACLLFMFLLTLLCSVSMNGFRRYLEYVRDTRDSQYEDSDYDVFAATFAMGYFCSLLYLLYTLLVAWSAISFTQIP